MMKHFLKKKKKKNKKGILLLPGTIQGCSDAVDMKGLAADEVCGQHVKSAGGVLLMLWES